MMLAWCKYDLENFAPRTVLVGREIRGQRMGETCPAPWKRTCNGLSRVQVSTLTGGAKIPHVVDLHIFHGSTSQKARLQQRSATCDTP